ncbi:hypothetical protein ACFQMM_02545 [Saliphagus sp. GCM10025308]
MTTDPQFDEEHIEQKREEIRNALSEEGITKNDLEEMTPDEVLDAVGTAMIKQQNAEDDDFDVNEEARKIIEESREMGDSMADSPPEGQTCEREGCDRDAVRGPGKEWLCEKHQKEFFRQRHG